MPSRLLDPFRSKRKIMSHHLTDSSEILKAPDHDMLQNSPDNYVVTPHRKRRPGFHNSPSQNPPFVPYSPSFIDDIRSKKESSASAPPSYYPGKLTTMLLYRHNGKNILINFFSSSARLCFTVREAHRSIST